MGASNSKEFFESYREGRFKKLLSDNPPVGGSSPDGAIDPLAEIQKGRAKRIEAPETEEIIQQTETIESLPAPVRPAPLVDYLPAQTQAIGANQKDIRDVLWLNTDAINQWKNDPNNATMLQQPVRDAVKDEITASKTVLANEAMNMYDRSPDFVKSALKGFGVDRDEFVRKMVTDEEGADELRQYAKAALPAIESEKNAQIEQLRSRIKDLPTKPRNHPAQYMVSPETAATNRKIVAETEAQIQELEKKYEQRQNTLQSAVFNAAALKVVNDEMFKGNARADELDPYRIGNKVMDISQSS